MKLNNLSPHFLGNYIFRGKIECLTGLHIGGSNDKLEIGGVDSPVIRDPKSKRPYIPGSSLKGKMRYLLEYALDVINVKEKEIGDVSRAEAIVRIFGIGADEKKEDELHLLKMKTGPTRLIVRDCYPDIETIGQWESMDTELLFTEYKPENTINRITAAANPRFIERVVTGSTFNFEMIYSIFAMTKNEQEEKKAIEEDLENIWYSLRLLENNFVGKSGSRGYGKIRFRLTDVVQVSKEDYLEGTEKYQKSMEPIIPGNLKGLTQLQAPKYNTSK